MDAPWIVVAAPGGRTSEPEFRPRRLFAGVIAVALVIVVALGALEVQAARGLAETEAVADASDTADLLAEVIVQPAITDGILTGDPAAIDAVDREIRAHVLDDSLVRVKLWDASGRILYSDDPRLTGRSFALDEEDLEAFEDEDVHAEVSDLQAPENVYERDSERLLEAYRSVRTPSGTPLLFESYFRYDEVVDRSTELWRSFAAVSLASTVLLVLLLLPVLARLLAVIGRSRRHRETLLQRALDASADERRRIAATVHDGAVQDLVAASFAVHGRGERAAADGDAALADDLRTVAATIRAGLGGLRSLLVDIYPPSLADAGLAAALQDLAATTRARGVAVEIDAPAATGLDQEGERLLFRVAHEALANVVKHAEASSAVVRLRRLRDRTGQRVVLDVVDDGAGFDAARILAEPEEGHLGLRILRDLALEHGAELRLLTAPGAGTHWQLVVQG
ncbi:integral membrane sensor signal transduction histidine kinase [Rathayibacter sp. VKM Ac-2759]|uniref:sensor histidine kinase n=1 Tax=Rathayibacter sp. VKM Ac-2759 TaxID=2609252 RepID=UPI001319251E|nr:ATP-binding protein [Rathayibacter sp. VKM Ac-2759]QHC66072.1 integral membrane sensor signal transduction histidine kinase [Rathayibacter sp. VKM Ac-2759]